MIADDAIGGAIFTSIGDIDGLRWAVLNAFPVHKNIRALTSLARLVDTLLAVTYAVYAGVAGFI